MLKNWFKTKTIKAENTPYIRRKPTPSFTEKYRLYNSIKNMAKQESPLENIEINVHALLTGSLGRITKIEVKKPNAKGKVTKTR